jgi:hypothetical protein
MVSWEVTMTLEITINNHLTALRFHIIGTVIMVVILYFLHWENSAVTIFSFFWLAYFIPAIYLHAEYYFKNHGQRLEILENEIILHDRNGEVRSYGDRDLQKVVLYRSASLDKGGVPLTPMESYHYAVIVPKKGAEIIVTCLMAPNVEEAIKVMKGLSYERKKRLFASSNFSFRLFTD